MQNIVNALSLARLGTRIKASTAICPRLLSPFLAPSRAAFLPKVLPYIGPIISFLEDNNCPLLANLHTCFPYISNPKDIRLDYALFVAPSPVLRDGFYQYHNLFNALVDAMYVALERYYVNNVEVGVAETAWPSAGGTAATTKNAKIFNNNLIQHVKGGTPGKPRGPLATYIYALNLIDEGFKETRI